MTRPTPSSDPSADTPTEGLVRRASLLLAIASSLVALAIYITGENQWNLLPAAMMSALGWLSVVIRSPSSHRFVAIAVVFGTQVVAILAVFSYGSIRGAPTFLFAASIAGAGTFLARRGLLASVVSSVTALAILTWIESQGYLRQPTFEVGPLTWVIHACVLAIVGGLMWYARERTHAAFDSQKKALEENKALTQDRDRHLERFARIFRTSPVAMILQTAATAEILDVNPAFERCYGYTRDEVIGKTDHFLWGQLDQRHAYLSGLRDLPRVHQFSIVGKRVDGSHFDAHICSELSTNEDDMLVITAVTDMTSQNQIIERLRRSEERFAKAFNLSPLLTTITRMSDGTFLEVNQSDDVLPHVALSDLKGKSTHSIGLWMSDEDRARYIEKLQTEGQVKAFESQMQCPGGAKVDLRIWAVPIEIEGEACILSCTANVTDEKRRSDLLLDIAKGMTGPTAQAFFHALTERMASSLGADMVLIGEITPDNCIQTLAVTHSGARADNFRFAIAGSACETALVRHELSVFSSGLSSQTISEAQPTGTNFDAGICQTLHDSDGHAVGVLSALWLRPIEATDEMRALMAIFSSRATAELMRLRSERQTEQLNNSLELRVQARTAELRKLNAELDSFAYSISHDLKSPLRAIDGFTQLLCERLEDRLDDEERHLMGRVLGATHRMGNLMADLLNLTRVSQDAMDIKTVDLSQLANEIAEELGQRAPHPGLQWRIHPNMSARCDERLMRIALENLFENARKFTRDEANPLIEFGCEAQNTPAWFYVKDNGVGFSMAHANKLFKPFQRLHMPSAGFEGTGIGLATVRRIVERHGGSIYAEGTESQGAVFRFHLDGQTESGRPATSQSNASAQRP